MYIKNAWYVVATPTELEAGIVSRTVMEIPIAVARLGSGELVALHDRCPHRFAPLSLGVATGSTIRCAYHGAEFDCHGRCTKVPGQQGKLDHIKVRSFPVIERHGLIWVWPGDPELAAAGSMIPSGVWRSDDSAWDGGYGLFESIGANYALINDNLIDITHAEFVHPDSFGAAEMRVYRDAIRGDELLDGKMTYTKTDRTITFRMRFDSMAAGGPFYRWMVATSLGKDSYDEPIDFVMEVTWEAPTTTSFLLNAKPAGANPSDAAQVCNMHFVTPEDKTRSHYFYRSVKNYGSQELGEAFLSGVAGIFEQDRPVLEGQQKRIGERDLFDQGPSSFAGDRLQLMARRINETLLRAESDQHS